MACPSWTFLLFALPEEAAPLIRRLPKSADEGRIRGALYTSAARRLSIYCSGAGARRAGALASSILDTADASRLIICGFAGGLIAQATPGTLILAESVTDHVADTRNETFPADSRLLATAESVRVPGGTVLTGGLATTDRVLLYPREKSDMCARTGAIAVDMETAGALREARLRDVPWLAVRAVTDGAADTMPLDFNALAGADGDIDRGRVVRAALARPTRLPGLIRLGKRSALAARRLADFLEIFVSALPE